MKKYLQAIKDCPLFFGIGDDELLRMLSCLGATVGRFDKRETVFAEGSDARRIGVVLSGSVRVEKVDYYGNRSILSNLSSQGIFGDEFSLAGDRRLPVSVAANEDCVIMFIEASHILHTCHNNCAFHQRLIFNLMKNLALKNILFHQRIEITSKRTTREKLLAYLSLSAEEAGGASFEIPFDRQELADFLEVDRTGLSSEIGRLVREGIIKNEKRKFTLL